MARLALNLQFIGKKDLFLDLNRYAQKNKAITILQKKSIGEQLCIRIKKQLSADKKMS